MFIALVNLSHDPDITTPLLERIAQACEIQLYQHYAPFWQSAGMNVRVSHLGSPELKQQDCCPLGIYDKPDEPNALGYHLIQGDQSTGKVFWGPIQASGGDLLTSPNSLSVTISHEILEAVGDPYVNFWADVDGETQEAIELCDRVEADAYTVEGVAVSNFLSPRAFRDGSGPYDWMNLLKSPWDIRPEGYVIRRKGAKVFNLYGSSYSEDRKALKTSPLSRLARRQALVASKGDSQ